jgi:hypothetical protein
MLPAMMNSQAKPTTLCRRVLTALLVAISLNAASGCVLYAYTQGGHSSKSSFSSSSSAQVSPPMSPPDGAITPQTVSEPIHKVHMGKEVVFFKDNITITAAVTTLDKAHDIPDGLKAEGDCHSYWTANVHLKIDAQGTSWDNWYYDIIHNGFYLAQTPEGGGDNFTNLDLSSSAAEGYNGDSFSQLEAQYDKDGSPRTFHYDTVLTLFFASCDLDRPHPAGVTWYYQVPGDQSLKGQKAIALWVP